MSALVGLGPLLDPSALWGIAQHLWTARERLALRTGAEFPTASQLLVALRLYIADQDRRRAEAPELVVPPERPPSPRVLLDGSLPSSRAEPSQATGVALLRAKGVPPEVVGRLISLAELAYCDTTEALVTSLGSLCSRSEVLQARSYSSKYHPAYFIAHDPVLDALVLSVRGSKETSDFITNLMVDTAPFDGGYGHSGIVQSAQNLVAVIYPSIAAHLDALRPANGLQIVGHSLGAAIASLVAIILRTDSLDYHIHFAQPPPEAAASGRASNDGKPSSSRSSAASRERRRSAPEHADEDVSVYASISQFAHSKMSSANCVVFSAPPCLSPDVAEKAKALGVTTFVHGLDMVPRLSAGSLDRLLLAVSRYDWRAEATGNAEDWMRPFLSQALGPAGGAAAASTIANVGPDLFGPVIGLLQQGARQALAAEEAGGRGGADARSNPLRKFVLGAVAVGGGFLLNQFYHDGDPHTLENRNGVGGLRQRAGDSRQSYPFAARFGMSPDQVEEALVPNQPRELHLVGTILHIDRPFTLAENYREDTTLPPATILERTPEYFVDVEASTWMLHDHALGATGISLTSVLHDGGPVDGESQG